ncbi:MAG: LptF/LptG family permease [Planctomycetota bacterium]
MMMGRLDRYVARTLLSSWAATLLLVVFLFVVMDLLLHMPQYLARAHERGIGLGQVLGAWLRFHLISFPGVFVSFAPFVTVVGSMFAIARLMGANEIAPMIFTGRSTMRVFGPAVALGLLSAGAMAATWEVVLPPLSRSIERLGNVLSPDEARETADEIVLQSNDLRQTLMCGRFWPDEQRMEGVVLVDKGTGPQDRVLVVADAALWNPEAGSWELIGGERVVGDVRHPESELRMENVTPDILWMSGKEAKMSSLLAYSELSALMRLSPGRSDLVIAFHYHWTWPLANVVLLLLALPFAVHFERGGKIGRVALAIAICAAYFVFDLICQNLGRRDFVHPVVAAWTPMIVFGSLGVVLFGGMRS